ncbi:c-type cytochrome [Aurantiacibacter suaedae]|uniref:c-type cytochrome n=1 Tax=Aurantiacibacter suaedae TaxID=2545755 RepID=UPI0010F69F21|nr:c-type cytochrome [Aurantiacibacter suaedae]
MRISISLATVSLAALALAACGGPPENANEAEVEEVAADNGAVDEVELAQAADAAEAASDDEVTEVDVEVEEPAATASASPSPKPSASASARPSATPTQAAAASAGPPDSFAICTVCHSVTPGQNMVGPSLAGVVGRKAGGVSGFAYSASMKSSNLTWNEANLRRYLVDPHAVVPGGSMPAPGVNAQQAGEIVTYLKTL